MTTDHVSPDTTFVTLIHQALRVDGQKLRDAVDALDSRDRAARAGGLKGFFEHYRQQLALHHSHEDTVFFPALEAKIGAQAMHLRQLQAQHEELETTLSDVEDVLDSLVGAPGDWEGHKNRATEALSSMMSSLVAHLDLEDRVVLPSIESQLNRAEYRHLEAKARRNFPRSAARFTAPWLVDHATSTQRTALFRAAPPLKVLAFAGRRSYRRLAGAMTPPLPATPTHNVPRS